MSAVTDRLRTLVHDQGDGELPSLSDELVRALDLPADVGDAHSIAEVASLTGVTAHTLRYYERIGLVDVGRDDIGHRLYDREALGRVVFISRLRMSDMPIRDIHRYIELVREGESTVAQRLAMMQAHRASILARMHDLQWALAVTDYKIATYGGTCAP